MLRPVALLALLTVVGAAGCAPAGPKEIHVTVTENGFEPNNVTIRKGQSAVLVMTRKTQSTCATEAMFTETGKRYDLPLDQPVRVDLTNVSPGTLHYACAMDMIKGTVTIE